MARRFVIKELEAAHGNLHEVIPPLVNKGGQKLAADILGTTQSTVSKWLKDNGYVLVNEYRLREIPKVEAELT